MFKRHYLKNHKIVSQFLLHFFQSTSNLVHFEKKGQLQSLNISEVIDSKKYGYLNARKSPF